MTRNLECGLDDEGDSHTSDIGHWCGMTRNMICSLRYDGDSHTRKENFLGMTVLFGARTSLCKFQFLDQLINSR